MKNTIITLILTLVCIISKAQSNNIPYYSQPNLQKFAGEWMCSDGNGTFKIILKVEKTFLKGKEPVYMDFIVGDYSYNKGGSTSQNSNGNYKAITSGGFEDRSNINKIKFLFNDLGRVAGSQAPLERGTLELISATQAKWTIKPGEGIKVEGPGIKKDDYGIYVPRSVVLTKIQ